MKIFYKMIYFYYIISSILCLALVIHQSYCDARDGYRDFTVEDLIKAILFSLIPILNTLGAIAIFGDKYARGILDLVIFYKK